MVKQKDGSGFEHRMAAQINTEALIWWLRGVATSCPKNERVNLMIVADRLDFLSRANELARDYAVKQEQKRERKSPLRKLFSA